MKYMAALTVFCLFPLSSHADLPHRVESIHVPKGSQVSPENASAAHHSNAQGTHAHEKTSHASLPKGPSKHTSASVVENFDAYIKSGESALNGISDEAHKRVASVFFDALSNLKGTLSSIPEENSKLLRTLNSAGRFNLEKLEVVARHDAKHQKKQQKSFEKNTSLPNVDTAPKEAAIPSTSEDQSNPQKEAAAPIASETQNNVQKEAAVSATSGSQNNFQKEAAAPIASETQNNIEKEAMLSSPSASMPSAATPATPESNVATNASGATSNASLTPSNLDSQNAQRDALPQSNNALSSGPVDARTAA